MFNNQIIAGSSGQGGGSFYSYSIDQSLRFNDDDSAKLYFDPTSDGNKQVFTFSAWIKRANLGLNYATFFSGSNSSGHQFDIRFDSADNLRIINATSVLDIDFKTNRIFRDVGSWYHIVVAVDTTDATLLNRVKIYVNGVQETSLATTTCTQNTNCVLNTASNQTTNVGALGYTTTVIKEFDGYMAEVHFVDGTSLAPTSFGETINGVWVPKAYDTADGAYGTNGFYLSFADSAAIGDDLSGNTNDFTATNLAASDVVPDSPVNNFPNLNTTFPHANMTFSEGNLKWTSSTNNRGGICNFEIPHGTGEKYYFEYVQNAFNGPVDGDSAFIGINVASVDIDAARGGYATSYSYLADSGKRVEGTTTQVTYGSAWGAGDVIGVAIDRENNTINFAKNNTYQGTFSIPATTEFFPWFGHGGGTNSANGVFNFGQDSSFAGSKTSGSANATDENGYGDFYYTPPTGFKALCSANLPEATIGPNSTTTSDEHFNTVLYTGTGASNSITGVNFQSDFTWIKSRSSTYNNVLWDTVRGATKQLISNTTGAESTQAQGLTSFDSDGFTLGTNANINNSGSTYVGWNWKAGGTAVSNTDGSITSSVSANQDAGFSIVTWTGNGTSGATVGHGLTSPEFSIVKNRDATTNWDVCWVDFSSGTSLNLDDTTAEFSPTQGYQTLGLSTITLNSGGSGVTRVNTNNQDYVAYVFKSVEGFSKVGKYVGNANADGTFVYTGFRPAWVMTKMTTNGSQWTIIDNTRNTFNAVDKGLVANTTAAEVTGSSTATPFVDFVSNGFKIRSSQAQMNQNGDTFIYLAFAEDPFKYANAR